VRLIDDRGAEQTLEGSEIRNRERSALDAIRGELILTGFSRMEDVGVIPDREEAIKFTIENAVENDVIVIAGKGHENYQIIGDKTLHFSDQEVAEAYLTKK